MMGRDYRLPLRSAARAASSHPPCRAPSSCAASVLRPQPRELRGVLLESRPPCASRPGSKMRSDFGHRLIEQAVGSRVEFPLRPMRELRGPIMVGGAVRGRPAQVRGDILGSNFASGCSHRGGGGTRSRAAVRCRASRRSPARSPREPSRAWAQRPAPDPRRSGNGAGAPGYPRAARAAAESRCGSRSAGARDLPGNDPISPAVPDPGGLQRSRAHPRSPGSGRRPGKIRPSARTLRSRVCNAGDMSPISSRKRVPHVSLLEKRPRRSASAPVNAPFSWPNNSDSRRSAVNAAVLRATKALLERGLWRCRARATSSLPVPDSPVISTVMLERDNRADGAEYLLHGGRLAEELRNASAGDVGIDRHRRLLRGAPHEIHGLVDVERLRQVLEGASLIGGDGGIQVRVRGHDDDRAVRGATPECP